MKSPSDTRRKPSSRSPGGSSPYCPMAHGDEVFQSVTFRIGIVRLMTWRSRRRSHPREIRRKNRAVPAGYDGTAKSKLTTECTDTTRALPVRRATGTQSYTGAVWRIPASPLLETIQRAHKSISRPITHTRQIAKQSYKPEQERHRRIGDTANTSTPADCAIAAEPHSCPGRGKPVKYQGLPKCSNGNNRRRRRQRASLPRRTIDGRSANPDGTAAER